MVVWPPSAIEGLSGRIGSSSESTAFAKTRKVLARDKRSKAYEPEEQRTLTDERMHVAPFIKSVVPQPLEAL
jgi:hypothetical protein